MKALSSLGLPIGICAGVILARVLSPALFSPAPQVATGSMQPAATELAQIDSKIQAQPAFEPAPVADQPPRAGFDAAESPAAQPVATDRYAPPVSPSNQESAEPEIPEDYFHDALAPYGTWSEVEGYGAAWTPANTKADWAPYTEGQWVYTDAGWTWVGDEPYAGIVFHYGRWIQAGNQGWYWVPGYEWGPAWVSWRDNEEYIGWAPLPPEAAWEPKVGVGVWVDEVYGIGPSFYSFCHHRDFGDHWLHSVILARAWNSTIMVQTVNITNITYNHASKVVYCGGPSYERASRLSHSPISTLTLDRRYDFDFKHHDGHKHPPLPGGNIVGSTLAVVAPRVIGGGGRKPSGPKPGKVIAQNQVNRGWVGKGASGDLEAVRHAIEKQVAGMTPKTHPAKPVVEKELLVVPTRRGLVSVPLPLPQPVVQPKPQPQPVYNTTVAVAPEPTPSAQPIQVPATTAIPAPQAFRNNTYSGAPQQNFGSNHTTSPGQPQAQMAVAPQRQQQQPVSDYVRKQQALAESQARQQALIQQGREAAERQRQQEAQAEQQRQLQQQQAAAEMARARQFQPQQQPRAFPQPFAPSPSVQAPVANNQPRIQPQTYIEPPRSQPQVQVQTPAHLTPPSPQTSKPAESQHNDDRDKDKKKK